MSKSTGAIVASIAFVGSTQSAYGQTETPTAAALAARSAIIVSGTVSQIDASLEPLLAANGSTVVVRVTHTFAGVELIGDQAGRMLTVVLKRPGSVKVGSQATFFGNLQFAGKTVTIADEGEIATPDSDAIAAGIVARREAPIRARLAIADLVVRGTVQDIRELEPGGDDPAEEHDPAWRIATVRVAAAARGAQAGDIVPVIFAASIDIEWYNAPKPHVGQDAVFIAHPPTREEAASLHAPNIKRLELVTNPYDVLPASDAALVFGMVSK